jgi:hypothetical protein
LAFERLTVPKRDIVTAGDAFVSGHRGIGALLQECTNMVPYPRVLSEGLRPPALSICTFVTWFRCGLVPRDFGHPARAPRE